MRKYTPDEWYMGRLKDRFEYIQVSLGRLEQVFIEEGLTEWLADGKRRTRLLEAGVIGSSRMRVSNSGHRECDAVRSVQSMEPCWQ